MWYIFTPSLSLLPYSFFPLANLLHNFCCLGDVWYPDIWPPFSSVLISHPHLTGLLQSPGSVMSPDIQLHTALRGLRFGPVTEPTDDKVPAEWHMRHGLNMGLNIWFQSKMGFISCSSGKVILNRKKKKLWKHIERSWRSTNAGPCSGSSAELAFGLNTCRAKGQSCCHS